VDYGRTDAIRAFYETVASFSDDDNNKEAKERAQKVTTPHKMAALMRKLIAKYHPDSIQEVQDKSMNVQEERMRQMLNKDNDKANDSPEGTVVEETESETMEL
jgi:hypothetical protein